jgi:hypothetical protein
MKKHLLLATCLLFFVCLKAQTYTDGHLSVTSVASLSHDSTYCRTSYGLIFNVSVDSSFPGDVVTIVDTVSGGLIGTYTNTTGASPWTLPPLTYSTAMNDAYITIGGGYAHFYHSPRKFLHATDTIIIAQHDSLLVTNPCHYGTVSGHAYIDDNSNCTFDGGDRPITPAPVDLVAHFSGPIPTGTYVSGSGGIGSYTFKLQESWMTDYTVFVPPYYAFIFPTSPCFSGSYTFTTLPQTGVDFPLTCTSNIDVQCGALSPAAVRLHRPFYLTPYVSNTGCDTADGQLKLVKDSHVIYNAALSSHPADFVYGDTLVWNYSNLSNLSYGAYWNSFFSHVHLTPDTTVVVGDTLCFRVYTNILAADINPANNDYSFCLPVVYSYDPNVKEVMPKGTGALGYISPSDDTLTYTLHFQNTGSAEAEDIHIIDTLDSHIIPSSLKILGTSHNMEPKWLTPNVVQFTFANIHLPDSTTNEAASHGQVRFSIALNHGLPVGTQIRNTGYIYFDLNPPVVTNTTLNTIHISTTNGVAVVTQSAKVYPNPATDHIVVENLKGGEISIVDMKGVIVLSQQITDGKATIDVSRLPVGVYVLKTVNDSNTATTRFTKY